MCPCVSACVCLCVLRWEEELQKINTNAPQSAPSPNHPLGWAGGCACLHLAPPACPMPPHIQPQCTVLTNSAVEPRPWEAGAAQLSLPQHRPSSSWKQNSNNNGKKIIYIYIFRTSLKDPNGWNQSPPQQNQQEIKAKFPPRVRPECMSQLGPSSPGACPDLPAGLALAHLWRPSARGAPAAGGKAARTGLSH